VYYPQVFNLGSGNDTLISISNSLAVPTQISVNCWSQSGEVTNFLVNQPLAARSQMAFRPPSEFVVGSCLVHGGVNSSATWNFDVGGNIFNVGTSPLNAGDQEVSWSFPVGFAQDGAQLGMAVHNPNSEAVECTASIYSRDQLPDFDLTQTSLLDGSVGDDFPFSVPAYGQIASFFGEPFDAAEGLLSFVKVELRCSKPVLPLVLTQNPADGFPTPIEGTPAP
jgi:hypothetical protein